MNFLAHSLISLEIDEKANKKTLYGNFTGDFYKGLVDKIDLSDELKEGIVLHRIIDGISDRNENFLNDLLTEKFGIFKGIVADIFYPKILIDYSMKILIILKRKYCIMYLKIKKFFQKILLELSNGLTVRK